MGVNTTAASVDPSASTPTVSLPSVNSRAVGAILEPAIFLVVAAAIAVVEHAVQGPIGGFGPSAFWLAFWVMAMWSAWHWPAAQTLAASFTGNHIAMLDGRPAAPVTLAARELSRVGILYGLPLLAIEANIAPVLALMALSGLVIAKAPGRRAPWDFLAGTVVIDDFGGPAAALERTEVHSATDLQLDDSRNRKNRRARATVLALGRHRSWSAP